MHPSISMRSNDMSVLDMPPSTFEYDPSVFDMVPVNQLQEQPTEQPEPTDVTSLRKVMRIARATSGTTEIRLLRQSVANMADTFILEHAVMQPYQTTRVDLIIPDTPQPMNEAEALEAFCAAVKAKYPAEKLRNGRIVPIHQDLIK